MDLAEGITARDCARKASMAVSNGLEAPCKELLIGREGVADHLVSAYGTQVQDIATVPQTVAR